MNMNEDLQKLEEIFRQGFILENEYTQRKNALLGKTPSPPSSSSSSSTGEATTVDHHHDPEDDDDDFKFDEEQPADDSVPLSRVRSYSSYATYIFRVLKQVHPEIGISRKAMCVVDSFLHDVFDRLASEAGRLVRYNSRETLSSREVQTAVRLIFPGALARHAVSEGTKAVTKYNSASGVSALDDDDDAEEDLSDENDQDDDGEGKQEEEGTEN
eukprot:TRINITY_DN7551_c0_g2_i1.p1 TRINITY_DN7551_c0_g2~~TRINITY_DN7551_c0_g2_i1.p1  ORF type:complete len:214 (+),score=55.02 TRINITY_DN7551_c0_g2_i1:3-644(+)